MSHDHGPRPGTAEWDAQYASEQQIWSGEPNHALVKEVEGLRLGRALDVGCGEGADSVWLATQGWAVTGLDPSGVALERARAAGAAAGAAITWVRGGLEEVDLPEGGFDLVVAMYAALYRDTDPVALLTRLVAPGGTLLVVHHAEVDRERALEHGFDPDLYLQPADVAAQLPDGWAVDLHETRARQISGGAGAHHHDDLVVRASRA